MTELRDERPGDAAAIRALLEQAFPSAVEADLVDALRASCEERVSLVALEGERLLGHILFTPAAVVSEDESVSAGYALAPMAVLPERQREGIGSMLVQAGLERLEKAGCPFVVVLGHPAYYPRFGFVPASRHGVRSPWPGVPDDAFMIAVVASSAPPTGGVARYHPAFDAAALR